MNFFDPIRIEKDILNSRSIRIKLMEEYKTNYGIAFDLQIQFPDEHGNPKWYDHKDAAEMEFLFHDRPDSSVIASHWLQGTAIHILSGRRYPLRYKKRLSKAEIMPCGVPFVGNSVKPKSRRAIVTRSH